MTVLDAAGLRVNHVLGQLLAVGAQDLYLVDCGITPFEVEISRSRSAPIGLFSHQNRLNESQLGAAKLLRLMLRALLTLWAFDVSGPWVEAIGELIRGRDCAPGAGGWSR